VNNRPLVVELACGRGEFTVGLARVDASKNFIGVDIKGSRIWKGSTIAAEESLLNVAFLRTQIELLDQSFAEGEISELWITFPDPRPKDRDEKRRLHYRRIDGYLTPLQVPMQRYAGGRGVTRSYHRPLQDYVAVMNENGILLDRLVELPGFSPQMPGRDAKAAARAQREIPLFIGIRGVLS
jgi:hypothetical protein